MNISGQYCQCDDRSCPLSLSGVLCGGHGQCHCGQCECDAGWTGDACDCSSEVSACLSPDGVTCSGHGSCVCGECKCEDEYSGQLCSDCETCPDTCHTLQPCVECLAFSSGDLVVATQQPHSRPGPEHCLKKCDIQFLYREEDSPVVGPGWLHCRLKNVSYCWYSFYHMQGVVIMDTSHQECPVITQPDYAGIVIGKHKHVQYTHF